MPLPSQNPIVSCLVYFQIGFTFLVLSCPGKEAIKRVCLCVCVCACVRACVRACMRVVTELLLRQLMITTLIPIPKSNPKPKFLLSLQKSTRPLQPLHSCHKAKIIEPEMQAANDIKFQGLRDFPVVSNADRMMH